MPAQERSITIEERALGGDQPQRRHREAMARNTSPKGSNPRAEAHISQWDDAAGWDQEPDEAARHRDEAAVVPLQFQISPVRRQICSAAAMASRRTLGQAAGDRDRRAGGDLRHLFRRAVVAARRRADQSRCGNALAGGRDRGQYRPWQYRRGRRYADRAGRTDSHRGANPRHRGARPRPGHRRHRAEGRGETVRHRASDGTAACRKPQSGRCRTRGTNHAGRPGHGFCRRYRQTARHRRCLQARCRHGADIPPSRRPRPPRARRLRPTRRRTDCWPASTGSTASA